MKLSNVVDASLKDAVPPRRMATLSAQALLALRADMLRFARLQLRDREAAEDLVQEAIESALRHSDWFAGGAALKTWVFAILRNKVVDHLRRSSRSVNLGDLIDDTADHDDQVEAMFDPTGAWLEGARPGAWPTPEDAMSSRQFLQSLESCMAALPDRMARVFTLREVLGWDTGEIGRHLGLSESNCHVILHRARLRLRACLSMQGIGGVGGSQCGQ